MKKERNHRNSNDMEFIIIDGGEPFWAASYYDKEGTYHKKLPVRLYWPVCKGLILHWVRKKYQSWRSFLHRSFHTGQVRQYGPSSPDSRNGKKEQP